MIRYLIFRHGESSAKENVVRRDTPLTVCGREQADKLGQRLAHFNAADFYTSPLLRARQTAKIVNRYLNLNLGVDTRLREVGGYRMWHEVIYEQEPEEMTLEDFNKAQLGIASFLAEQKTANNGNTVLLSTHGNLIKALLAITIGITDRNALDRLVIANTGLTILEWLKDDDYQLVVFNDSNHLGELMFR